MASYAVPARSHWFQLVPVATRCPVCSRLPLLFCFCQSDFLNFPKQKFAKTVLNGCPIESIYFLDHDSFKLHDDQYMSAAYVIAERVI